MLTVKEEDIDKISEAFYLILKGKKPGLIELPKDCPDNELLQQRIDELTDGLRLPPQSLEAEQSVLGGLMLDNRAIDEVTEIVSGDDFYRSDHRAVFRAICALTEQNDPADVVTVSEWLDNLGELESVGGLAYLGQLAQSTPNPANVAAYARIVRERAILRRLIAAANEIVGQSYNPEGRTPAEVLEARWPVRLERAGASLVGLE